VVATAEKTEQRLLFSLITVFSGVYSNFLCFARTLQKIFTHFGCLPGVLANFCNYRPHVVTRPLSTLSEWLKRGRGMLTAEKRGSALLFFPNCWCFLHYIFISTQDLY